MVYSFISCTLGLNLYLASLLSPSKRWEHSGNDIYLDSQPTAFIPPASADHVHGSATQAELCKQMVRVVAMMAPIRSRTPLAVFCFFIPYLGTSMIDGGHKT